MTRFATSGVVVDTNPDEPHTYVVEEGDELCLCSVSNASRIMNAMELVYGDGNSVLGILDDVRELLSPDGITPSGVESIQHELSRICELLPARIKIEDEFDSPRDLSA